ncbi:hypothetical protein RSOLAG22IIIB_00995 [Rhizoctonia solani]|uniref:Uncharacterized protein n=1 Tax=Rhizoctonia solani TaxID=456999 RepID=A0A0K6G1T1_9AGAM|nr:unnamed protein product [Rhizoctonia solani]CUA72328.1 hypothetical protein RSOLAG22IIIB_00995 [Rhizoctonia solani]
MSTSAQRWAKALVYSTGVIFGGWALMRATTPNPQEFYDSLAPDHKRAVDAARARGVGVSQPTESLRRQQLDPEAPVWADKPPPKRPS